LPWFGSKPDQPPQVPQHGDLLPQVPQQSDDFVAQPTKVSETRAIAAAMILILFFNLSSLVPLSQIVTVSSLHRDIPVGDPSSSG